MSTVTTKLLVFSIVVGNEDAGHDLDGRVMSGMDFIFFRGAR